MKNTANLYFLDGHFNYLDPEGYQIPTQHVIAAVDEDTAKIVGEWEYNMEIERVVLLGAATDEQLQNMRLMSLTNSKAEVDQGTGMLPNLYAWVID